jgi:ABC-2 type transport system ATP-binding protein
VRKGEIFGFLGANGAGKTTTIRMLCGLLLPTSGKAMIAGHDIYTHSFEIKQAIGYMSQKFSLYEEMTVYENLEFYCGIYGKGDKETKSTCREVAAEMGLAEIKNKITREIPAGLKQRLALSCAVAHKPQILFLDEPTGGVDPISRRDFWELIYTIAHQGATVFVTTHYMDEAEYCNRLSIMHNGRIVAEGSPLELKNRYQKQNIEQVFIHLVKSEAEKTS